MEFEIYINIYITPTILFALTERSESMRHKTRTQHNPQWKSPMGKSIHATVTLIKVVIHTLHFCSFIKRQDQPWWVDAALFWGILHILNVKQFSAWEWRSTADHAGQYRTGISLNVHPRAKAASLITRAVGEIRPRRWVSSLTSSRACSSYGIT